MRCFGLQTTKKTLSEHVDVIVIGAGLAGLSAASYLARRYKVLVIESSSCVGGQCAGKWEGKDPKDLGVHGIYPRYRELRKLIGMTGGSVRQLVRANNQHIITPDGRLSRVRMPRLPAPFHSIIHSCLIDVISYRDRLRLLKGAARLLEIPVDTPGLDDISIKELADKAGIPNDAFRTVFEPLAWFGFFLDPRHVSANAYLSALRFLILGQSDSWRASWVPSPNGDTLVQPLLKFIRQNKGDVICGVRVTGISFEGDRVTGVQTDSLDKAKSSINCSWIVCAVPPSNAAPLLDTLPGGSYLARSLRQLGKTEVQTFRFWFELGTRPPITQGVVLTENAGFVYFALNQFMPAYTDRKVQVIEVQCSSDTLEQVQEGSIRDRVIEIFPNNKPRLLRIEEQRRVTYARYSPGSATIRPNVYTPWPNLFLAGDWVNDQQGSWFMERAVSTGRIAARAVLGIDPPWLKARSLEGIGVRWARVIIRHLMGGLMQSE
jgi:carotenoid phi-ring synthase / carotenoid chi-ring synthase